jgi:hypothetical protein
MKFTNISMQKKSFAEWAEKRIKRRHQAPGLRAKISRPGVLKWVRPAVDVFCLDINRYGMAIESRYPFREKSFVYASFKGKYIVQSNVKSEVTSCIEKGGVYRISLVFSYAQNAKDYNRRVDNSLSRIESIYSSNPPAP